MTMYWLLSPLEFNAIFTCDNSMVMFADNKSLGDDDRDWKIPFTYKVPLDTRVISVIGTNYPNDKGDQTPFGILGSTSHGLVTDKTWKCSSEQHPGWNSPDFDDQDWPLAKVVANHGASPWGKIRGIAETAKWIWANEDKDIVYCRLNLQ